jgi:hypothetical protein
MSRGGRSAWAAALLSGVLAACGTSTPIQSEREHPTAKPSPSISNRPPHATLASWSRQTGLTVQVPQHWQVLPARACLHAQGPAVVTGVDPPSGDCTLEPRDIVVMLGYGGPPNSPIPSGNERDFRVHGVAVRMFTGVGFEGSWLFALFPGRRAWFLGRSSSKASGVLRQARDMLATVQARADADPPGPPINAEYTGQWHVHGAELKIPTPERGILDVAYAACHGRCLESAVLALHAGQAPDGSTRVTATVNKILHSDPETGRQLEPPITDGAGAYFRVGDAFTLTYVAPDLLMESDSSKPLHGGGGIGNPYWCGEHMASHLSYACGL